MDLRSDISQARRLAYLDSIRGIAALIVVTSHLSFTSDALSFIDTNGIKLFRASGFAVSVFFVLSGFVLFRQLQHDQPQYLEFIVRRALRLFPPCIVAVSSSYAIYLLWSPSAVPHLSEWFNEVTWPTGVTLDQYVMHLTLTGENALLRPIWSLVYEWRVSIVFPLVVAAFLAAPKSVSFVTFGAAIALAKTQAWQATDFSWVLYTVFYGSFFLAGVVLARYHIQISDFLGNSRYLRYAILATVFYWTDLRSQQSGLMGVFYSGIAAMLLIAAAGADRDLQRILEIRPLVFLGRISYSLYLWHMIVIGVLFRALDGMPPLLIGALCLGFSVALAYPMFLVTEAPFVKLGRLLAARRPGFAHP